MRFTSGRFPDGLIKPQGSAADPGWFPLQTPGVALPIAKARLKIGEFDQTVAVAETDKFVAFRAALRAGPIELQTWFLDAGGTELCGAYYVEAKRLD